MKIKMKKYLITWKHAETNTRGEAQNQIPKQSLHTVKAKDEAEARAKFLIEYPALYIHSCEEVGN